MKQDKKQLKIIGKTQKGKSSNHSKNGASKIALNSVAGAALGAAIGGVTGAALTNKKSREVLKDVVTRLAQYTLDVVDRINIESDEDMEDAKTLADSPTNRKKS